MSRRWVNDPEHKWVVIQNLGFSFLGLAVVVFLVWGIFGIVGCVRDGRNEQLIQNDIYQSNHKEVVKLKPDVITCIHLDAKWDQKWDYFKSCESYELVTIQNIKVAQRYGSNEAVEIWIKVKQPVTLNFNYTSYRKDETIFLYVRLEFRESKK